MFVSIALLSTVLASAPQFTETTFTEREVKVRVVTCSLTNGLEAAVSIQPAPEGKPGASSVCADPLAAAKKAGFVAAINATAFMYPLDAPKEERNTMWYEGKPVRLFGLAVADGVRRNPEHHLRQVLWFDETGRGRVGHPGAEDRPVHAVADWEGPILEKGEVLSRDKPMRYRRAFAGLSDNGWTLHLAVAEGGRGEGLTLAECGEFLKSLGCSDGINLDGGGSACLMVVRDGVLEAVSPKGYRRPVPVVFGVRQSSARECP